MLRCFVSHLLSFPRCSRSCCSSCCSRCSWHIDCLPASSPLSHKNRMQYVTQYVRLLPTNEENLPIRVCARNHPFHSSLLTISCYTTSTLQKNDWCCCRVNFCCLHYANPPTDRLSTHRPAGASLHAPRLLGVHGIYVLGCLGLDWLVPSRTSQPHGRHQRRTQQTALEYNSETTTKTAVGSTGLGRVTGIGFSHQLQQQQRANHNQGENRENRIKKHWTRIGPSSWQCNAAAQRF